MKIFMLVAALLAAQPGAALGCSIPFDPRPAEVQQDERARWSYARSEAIAEAVAIQSSRRREPGIVRVLRVIKGPYRPGRLLVLDTVDPSLCGAGSLRRGERGLIRIDRLNGRLVFGGWLPSDYLQRLDRLGLRPLGSPAPRR